MVPRVGSAWLFAPSTRDMALWRKLVFAVAYRNAASAVAYFGLPGNAVIELGVQACILLTRRSYDFIRWQYIPYVGNTYQCYYFGTGAVCDSY